MNWFFEVDVRDRSMSPFSSIPSPSKKLLIATPKPKSETESGHRRFPQNSESSHDAPPPQKRSRDLPNLSDCHGCGRRISYTNPKERLRPLDSFWRIVLLCLRCRTSLRLQQICSYCFDKKADCGDVFVCEICSRKIHKDCVRKYGKYPPWCYLGVESSRFSICIDCWVPQVIRKTLGFSWCDENKGLLTDKDEQKVEKKAKEKDDKQHHRRSETVDGKCLVNGNCVDGSKSQNVENGVVNRLQTYVRDRISKKKKKKCSVKGNFFDGSKDQHPETNASNVENEQLNHGVESVSCVGVKGLQTYVRDKNRKVWELNIDPAFYSPTHSPDNCSPSTQVPNSGVSIDTLHLENPCESRSPEILFTYKHSRFKRRIGSA